MEGRIRQGLSYAVFFPPTSINWLKAIKVSVRFLQLHMNFTTWGFKIIGWTFDILTVSIPTAMNKPLSRVFLPTCGALPNDRTAKKKAWNWFGLQLPSETVDSFRNSEAWWFKCYVTISSVPIETRNWNSVWKKKIQSHYNKLWLPWMSLSLTTVAEVEFILQSLQKDTAVVVWRLSKINPYRYTRW